MQLTITVNKQSIYTSVELVTGFTGKSVGERVDNIMASDDETTLMDDLIKTAVTTLIGSKRKYSPVVNGDKIQFDVPDNFNAGIRGSIEDLVNKFIANRVLSDWFFIVRLPENSKRYMALAEADMAGISNLFCSRTKN